jgi:hypothetical protein
MTTTTAPASTAIAVTEPVFSTPERLALAMLAAHVPAIGRREAT